MRYTATDNLACLIAIVRALTWPTDDPVANPILPIGRTHSRPICIDRYDNEYAAMIATGVWKAKKHKDAAPLAQRAWKWLKAQKGERVFGLGGSDRAPVGFARRRPRGAMRVRRV